MSFKWDANSLLADVEGKIGPWVVGALVDVFLLAIVATQTVTYIREYPKDHIKIKLLVAAVVILSFLKTLQACAIVYIQNIQLFGRLDEAAAIPQAWWQLSVPFTTATVGIIVQIFFAARYWLLTGNYYIMAIILIALVTGYVGAFLMIIATVSFINTGVLSPFASYAGIIHFVGVLVCDAFISAGIAYHLLRSRVEFSTTGTLVSNLLRLTFTAAIPPTICAAINFAASRLDRAQGTYYQMIFNYAICKLYAISMLYTLNARKEIRRNLWDTPLELGGNPATTGRSGGLKFTVTKDIEMQGPVATFSSRKNAPVGTASALDHAALPAIDMKPPAPALTDDGSEDESTKYEWADRKSPGTAL